MINSEMEHSWRQEGNILLRDDERIDDLQRNHYGIIQRKGTFFFGMDAVLLSGFAVVKPGEKALDLGTGTGVIPILLAAKEPSDGTCQFIGLEIQDACAEMAGRSVRLNDLEQKVRIDHGDNREVSCNYRKAFFDIVTSNPPYISGNHGLTNPDEPKNIARHEICVTLSDVIEAAAYLLKPGGSFYMIHKPFRLAEIFEGLLANGLEPKRMQLIHPYIDKEPNMVIVEGVKGGNSRIKIEPPLIVYKDPGVYTEQLLATYEGEAKK